MKKSILILFVLVNLAFADFIRDDAKEIVIDTSTNLMWQDDNQTIGDANRKNWSNSITHCEGLTLGGYSDWHLPNFNELYMLADRSTYNPSLNPEFNNVASSYYWSATAYASGTSYAWAVHFYYGNDDWNDKTNTYFVRCVRLAD